MSNKSLYELIYASLLHDIGKVAYRAGRKEAHEVLSVELLGMYGDVFRRIGLDPRVITTLIKCHHREVRVRKGQENLFADCLGISDDLEDLLEKLISADRDSAPERTLGEDALAETGSKAFTDMLVSPLWVKDYYTYYRGAEDIDRYIHEVLEKSRICYRPVPLTILSRYLRNPGELTKKYRAVVCSGGSSVAEDYESILADFKDVFYRLNYLAQRGLLDYKTLLSTLMNYIKYSLLLVPDAIWGVKVPSTSLAAHMLLTAALSSSYYIGEGKIRLATIDLSGIQKYIASYSRTEGALRQLRGRSLLLQLVAHASANYILDALGLPPVHLILLRGDNAIFILPDKINGVDTKELFEKAVHDVERAVYELFHGDLYIVAAITEPFEISYEPPWSREYGIRGISGAFIELGEKLDEDKMKKFSRLKTEELCSHVVIGDRERQLGECRLCRSTILRDKLVEIKGSMLEEKLHLHDVDYVCTACLLAQIAGVAAENLIFVIEVVSKKITDTIYRELVYERKLSSKFVDTWRGYRLGIMPLKGLDRTYILVSRIRSRGIRDAQEEWAEIFDFLIRFIIEKIVSFYTEGVVAKEKIIVNVMKVNDPVNSIPKIEKLSKNLPTSLTRNIQIRYGFTTIFTNFSMMGLNELDALASKDDGSGRQTYLSWIKIDIDKMGETGLYMVGSIGRYITLSEIVSFYTNMIGYLILRYFAKHIDGSESVIGEHGIVIFSGGDDTFMVSRFVEGLYYLLYYHDWFEEFFGEIIHGDRAFKPLTVSAGCFVADYKYPAYLAYRRANSLLEQAKDEGRNRVCISIFTGPGKYFRLRGNGIAKESLEWREYKNILRLSTSTEIIEFIREHKILSYKLNQLLHDISMLLNNIIYGNGKEQNKKLLVEKIIAYAYLYNKQSSATRNKLDTVLRLIASHLAVEKPSPDTIIELMTNNKLENMAKTTIAAYRLLALQLLRIRERI